MAAGACLAALVAPRGVTLAPFAAIALPVVAFLFAWLAALWLVRRRGNSRYMYLRFIRHYHAAQRQRFTDADGDPSERAFLLKHLAREGSEVEDGEVTRFPYPRSLRWQIARLYWGAWGAAALFIAAAAAIPRIGPDWRVVTLEFGALCLALVHGYSGRYRRLRTVIEVTPTGISELQSGSRRRTLRFDQARTFERDADTKDYVLQPAGGGPAIRFDMHLMAETWARNLVEQYGGFPLPEREYTEEELKQWIREEDGLDPNAPDFMEQLERQAGIKPERGKKRRGT